MENLLDLNKDIIIEKFIKGYEVSVETFSFNGFVSILAISKRKISRNMTAKEIYSFNLYE